MDTQNLKRKWRKCRSKLIMFVYHIVSLLGKHLGETFLFIGILVIALRERILPPTAPTPFSQIPSFQELVALAILAVIYFIFYEIKRCLIKNTGATILVDDEKGALVAGSNGMLSLNINVNVDGWKPHNDPKKSEDEQKHWSQAGTVIEANNLHQEAHRRTLWAYVIEDIANRNTAHVGKNNKSIYILYSDDASAKAIGYTHVVPVNLHTWNKFKSGVISTSEIQADYICRYPPKTNDDKPFGLIILSLVMSKIPIPRKDEISRQFYAGRIITLALAHHLEAYRNREFKHTQVIPVMFQSANPAVKEFIEPYKKNPTEYSKEKVEIFCFDLENPHARPLPKCCALNEGGMVSLIQLPALASRYV